MSLPTPRLCIACQSCANRSSIDSGYMDLRCEHVDNMRLSLVDGQSRAMQSIEHCRSELGHCTETGIHWERKL